MANHRGRDIDSVISMCLVDVKMYGSRPMVLFIIINRNRAEKVIFIPLFLIMIFISLNRASAISVGALVFREGDSQKLFGRISAIRVMLIQFM